MSAAVTATVSAVCATVAVVITIVVIRRCRRLRKKFYKKIMAKISDEINRRNRELEACAAVNDVVIEIGPVEKFLHDILNEKPMRFSSDQLASCTGNCSTELGSGGFGVVYKGELPNGLPVAVKVLKVSMNKKVQEGFMAEIGLGLDTSRAEPSLLRACLWLALKRAGSARLAEPTSLCWTARLVFAMARLKPSRLVSQLAPE